MKNEFDPTASSIKTPQLMENLQDLDIEINGLAGAVDDLLERLDGFCRQPELESGKTPLGSTEPASVPNLRSLVTSIERIKNLHRRIENFALRLEI